MPIKNNWLSNHHSFGTGYKKGYKDGYVKAIEEFAEQIKARAHSTERNDWSADYMISIWESVIDEIAMELKGE